MLKFFQNYGSGSSDEFERSFETLLKSEGAKYTF
jgi:hypothetical protein